MIEYSNKANQACLSHATDAIKESKDHLQIAVAMLRSIAERTNDSAIAERLNQRSDWISEQLS